MSKISRAVSWNRLQSLDEPQNLIAMCAIRGLTAGGYPTKAGNCQMWARIVYEHAIGGAWEFAHLPTARAACLAFKNTRYVVKTGSALQPGDVLYKQGLPGGFGHVGVYVGGGMVAENSTIHDTTGDARGLRTLREFGAYTLAVRYPAPTQPK
jgi:cell wall-associated NlpC family hydrolase